MMPYINTPVGKREVSQIIYDLIDKYGTPCKSSEPCPSRYIKDGYEYHWFVGEDGKLRTTIEKVESIKTKKKK